MTIFTVEQKRFIVKELGNKPPASVRRESLHFTITGRNSSKLHAHLFSKLISSFQQEDCILRKNLIGVCKPSKQSLKKIEQVQTFTLQGAMTSLRKTAPQVEGSPFT